MKTLNCPNCGSPIDTIITNKTATIDIHFISVPNNKQEIFTIDFKEER